MHGHLTATYSKKAADPPGFEPGSEAPEASILSRLYYESKVQILAAEMRKIINNMGKIMEYIGNGLLRHEEPLNLFS